MVVGPAGLLVSVLHILMIRRGSCASYSGSGAIRYMILVGGLRVFADLARVVEQVNFVDAAWSGARG